MFQKNSLLCSGELSSFSQRAIGTASARSVTRMSTIVFVEELHIRWEAPTDLLWEVNQKIGEDLGAFGLGFDRLENPRNGDWCLALYQDGHYYRAQLVNYGRRFTKVFFLDYGNKFLVESSKLYKLSDELLEMEPLAKRVFMYDRQAMPPKVTNRITKKNRHVKVSEINFEHSKSRFCFSPFAVMDVKKQLVCLKELVEGQPCDTKHLNRGNQIIYDKSSKTIKVDSPIPLYVIKEEEEEEQVEEEQVDEGKVNERKKTL